MKRKLRGKLLGKSFPTIRAKDAMGREVTVDPNADLPVGSDLSQEMSDQAGLAAWYAGVAEQAYQDMKEAKYKLHSLYEDLYAKFRKSGDESNETQIKMRINRHSLMRAAYEKYNKARWTYGHLNVFREAFKQRGEMLRSVGANKRMELDNSDIRTLKDKARRRARMEEDDE